MVNFEAANDTMLLPGDVVEVKRQAARPRKHGVSLDRSGGGFGRKSGLFSRKEAHRPPGNPSSLVAG